MNAKTIIEKLGLVPLPEEGGWYRETYRSEEKIARSALPDRYLSDKSYSTAIYYLLTSDDISALHRVTSEEIFHFYTGDTMEMLLL
jgi:predicted cupin superfamily sugar epimerase